MLYVTLPHIKVMVYRFVLTTAGTSVTINPTVPITAAAVQAVWV